MKNEKRTLSVEIKSILIVILIFILSFSPGMLWGQQNYKVLTGEKTNNSWLKYSDVSDALYHFLMDEATKKLSERKETIRNIRSLDEWNDRQSEVRQKLAQFFGSFPDKTPLNAQVLETVEKDFYRVEKIIYESRPGYYVTSALFLPREINEKHPAILYASGHQEWYNVKEFQEYILNLVKKGFIVFAYDPVGQNERVQFYNPRTEKSDIGIATTQHSYLGAQAAIFGSSQAQYMFWDGIRAIDYLESRAEVDAKRIGMVGTSGGGLQTAFIAALDDRIYAAAPANYTTSMKRLLETIGPQDAEQNLIDGISSGIDHGDLLEVRAPKPVLVLSSTRDFFSIQGARETIKEVTRIYEAYGLPEHFTHVEEDTPHKFSRFKMEATYTFFQKHLRNPGNPDTEMVSPLSPVEIQVTPTGQVATSFPRSKSESELIRSDAQSVYSQLKESRKMMDIHRKRVVQEAKMISGYTPSFDGSSLVFTGNLSNVHFTVAKYFIENEDRYPIPFLLVNPISGKTNGKAVLFLDPMGKESAMNSREEELIEMTRRGYTVLIPDVGGIGELKPTRPDIHSLRTEWDAASLIDKSIVGLQAEDISRLIITLQDHFNMTSISAVAFTYLCPTLLHAAVFDSAITNVALVRPVISYRQIAMSAEYDPEMVPGLVPGALPHYDLPDLMVSYAPRSLTVIGPTDAVGEPLPTDKVFNELGFVDDYYKRISSADRITIISNNLDEKNSNYLSHWIIN